MAYLNSNAVTVFPATLRSVGTAKYTTENNLAQMVMAAAGKDSFTLAKDASNLEFVIHGHYFKADVSDMNLASDANLYAWIFEDKTTKTIRDKSGNTSLDTSSTTSNVTFRGLNLLTSGEPSEVASTVTSYSLQLLSSGKLVNQVPKFEAITIGNGLATNVEGGVITTSGNIYLPATTVVPGGYGPTHHSEGFVPYSSAINIRIPEIIVDQYGRITSASTYSWPISCANNALQSYASNNIRPLLIGASLTSYSKNESNPEPTVSQWVGTTFYNNAISVSLNTDSTKITLTAPIFSGAFSGTADSAKTIYQTLDNTTTGYKPILVGNITTTGYGSVSFTISYSFSIPKIRTNW